MLYWAKPRLRTPEFMRMDDGPIEFIKWVETNLDDIMSDGPIVEFDHVYTDQDNFVQVDNLKYAKIWLQRWYPELALRPILWDPKQERSNEKT